MIIRCTANYKSEIFSEGSVIKGFDFSKISHRKVVYEQDEKKKKHKS